MDDSTGLPLETNKPPASFITLLHLTRAYNRKEISFDEWLRLTREWAEAIIQQHGHPQTGAAPD